MKETTDTSTTNSSRGGVMMSVDDILDLVISTEDHDNDESESYNSYDFRSSSPLSLSMKGDTSSLFVPSMPPTERAKTWHGMPSKTPRNELTRSSRNRQRHNYYASPSELSRNELTSSRESDLSMVGETTATTATPIKKKSQSSRSKHGVSSSQPPLPTTSRTIPDRNKPNIVESSFMPVEENRHFRSILEEYHKKNQTSNKNNNTEAISRFEIFEKSRRNEKTNGILW